MRRRGRVPALAAALAAAALAQALCFLTCGPPGRRRLRAGGARARIRLRQAALGKDSSSWVLPGVDKDTDYFIEGRADGYAFMQTSETLYIFAPVPPQEEGGEGEKTKCALELSEEGTHVRFDVAGRTVVEGKLAGGVKVGTEVWMIEDAPGGMKYVIAEADKITPGEVFTSVIAPEVGFTGDYSQLPVKLASLSPEEQAATVEQTLKHLQVQQGSLRSSADDHLAENGDVLTVSLQGFEVGPDGLRGAPLEIGAAAGTKFELGGGNFLPEVHGQLVGIAKGEERDVRVTLKRGELSGQEIICAVACQQIEEQDLPELDDDFAKAVKRAEQMTLAATEDGIPWEEQGQAETFTIDDLREEIAKEIRMAAQQQEQESVEAQLEEGLLKIAEVKCEWAGLDSQKKGMEGKTVDGAALEKAEVLAAVYHALLEREGLLSLINHDRVNANTWHALGTPKPNEQLAEVGSDPAREFQEEHRKALRRHEREAALKWLKERAKVVSAA